MNRQWCMIFGAFLLLLAGCDKQPRGSQETGSMASAPSAKLSEITAESEEGLVDLVFHVQDYKLLADGSQSIRVAGLHKGREVGFEVVLGPTWKRSKPQKDVPIQTSRGTVLYRRVGTESDTFLRVLDELYRVTSDPKAMAAETPFTGISLQGDPGNLASGPVKIKLFYEKGGENRYAELFTNIDLTAHKIEVREKDEEYRKQIIQALRGN